MHELALTEAILAIVEEHAEGRRVSRVDVATFTSPRATRCEVNDR